MAGFPWNIPQTGEKFTNVTWLSVVQQVPTPLDRRELPFLLCGQTQYSSHVKVSAAVRAALSTALL